VRSRPNNDEMLHRFILKKKHLRADGTIDAVAFLLEKKDEGKLSTFRAKAMSAKTCGSRFRKIHGCLGIRAGDVRSIDKEIKRGVDAIADPRSSNHCPGHVSIVRLPDPEIPEDYALAERAASLLRAQSSVIL
jgi:hypothetical protein